MEIIAKLLFTTLILFFNASYAGASSSESSKCSNKFKESTFTTSKTTAWAVSEQTALLYSNKQINRPYLKHNKFLGLYLIKTPKKMKYYFDIVPHRPSKLFSISKSGVKKGKIGKSQVGLNSFAHFSAKSKVPSLITASCCQLNGITTGGNNLIERDYIEHFLSFRKIDYGDIGIRVKQESGGPIVEAANPFFPDNNFQEGDIILKMNGRRTKNASKLIKKILFMGSQKKHTFEIVRKKEHLVLNVKSILREGGGLLSDTFLEPLGIALSEELSVIGIKKDSIIAKLGVHVGDKLLGIGKHRINTLSQVRSALSAEQSLKNKKILILFERKNFQFFIQIAKG